MALIHMELHLLVFGLPAKHGGKREQVALGGLPLFNHPSYQSCALSGQVHFLSQTSDSLEEPRRTLSREAGSLGHPWAPFFWAVFLLLALEKARGREKLSGVFISELSQAPKKAQLPMKTNGRRIEQV